MLMLTIRPVIRLTRQPSRRRRFALVGDPDSAVPSTVSRGGTIDAAALAASRESDGGAMTGPPTDSPQGFAARVLACGVAEDPGLMSVMTLPFWRRGSGDVYGSGDNATK